MLTKPWAQLGEVEISHAGDVAEGLRAGATGSVPHPGKLLMMMMMMMSTRACWESSWCCTQRWGCRTFLALLWDGGGSPWIILMEASR